VGGDGQEVMPDLKNPPSILPLPQPLQVRVARGSHPVGKGEATVIFTLEDSKNSQLSEDDQMLSPRADSLEVKTDENGIAKCYWKLEIDVNNPNQQVKAELKAGHNSTPI
jgi:hypothetical protein